MVVKKISLVVCVLMASLFASAQKVIDISLPPDAAVFFDDHGPFIVKETYDTKKPDIKVVILRDYYSDECIGYETYMKIFVEAKRLIEEKMGISSPISLAPSGDI